MRNRRLGSRGCYTGGNCFHRVSTETKGIDEEGGPTQGIQCTQRRNERRSCRVCVRWNDTIGERKELGASHSSPSEAAAPHSTPSATAERRRATAPAPPEASAPSSAAEPSAACSSSSSAAPPSFAGFFASFDDGWLGEKALQR
eukprot:GHVT01101430.1.p2 GENE.GHVT01101430.1~~GHVT01101430.1.p2  ORF type:complete len:144 (-),score=40.33 GHVT01101430.1:1051-1482(-)